MQKMNAGNLLANIEKIMERTLTEGLTKNSKYRMNEKNRRLVNR